MKMALFPAYNINKLETGNKLIVAEETEKPKSTSLPSWLSNLSFKKTDSNVVFVTEEKSSQISSPSNSAVASVVDVADDEKDVEIVYEKSKTSKKHRRKRSRSKSHERRHKKKRKKSPEVKETEKVDSIFVKPESMTSSSKLFVSDFKRDIENLQFGSVYKKQRAVFKSKVNFCLGATQRENVLFFEEKITKKLAGRYFTRKANKTLPEPKQILPLKIASGQTKFQEEFLPVETETEIDGEKCVFDPKIQMYRPIGDQSAVAETPELIVQNAEIISENKRFNNRLVEHPNDVKLWLEFLNFQDRFYDAKAHQKNVKLTKLALIERKLSILDKAIEQNSNSFELKLLRLDLGLEAGWDREKLKAEWKRLEFNHVNQPIVWIGRLKFAYSYFSQFTVSRQASLFDHCLEKLSTVMSSNLITHPCLPNTEDYFVDFLVGKLNLWRVSGHVEKVFAFGQALLEFNFLQPEIVKGAVPVEQKRQLFEMFWDSNSPRIGDNNALGWSCTVEMKQPVVALETDSNEENVDKLEDEIIKTTTNQAELWLKLENLRQTYHWHPFVDSTDPEDPERVVLFDDIVKGLHNVIDTNNRFKLILKILFQFGVNIPQIYSTNETVWFDYDNQLQKSFEIFDTLPKLENPTLINVDEFAFRLLEHLETCVGKTERLFLVYIQIFHKCSMLQSDNSTSAKELLKSFTKFSKQILAKEKNRNDFILYGAYAEGLFRLGNANEAANVLQTILGNLQIDLFSQPSNSLDYLTVLHLTNLLCYVLLQDKDSANTLSCVQQLLSSLVARGEMLNVLKTKKAFLDLLTGFMENRFDESSFLINWLGCATSLWANLSALFAYASSPSVENASAIFVNSRNYFLKCRLCFDDKRSIQYLMLDKIVEQMFEKQILLIDYHLAHFGGAPRNLHKIVSEALEYFPNNCQFLKLLCDSHLNGHLIIGLRRYFSDLDATSPVRWLAAIYAEFSRYLKIKEQNDYCDLHKLRHLLQRALDICRNSVTFWRLSVKLETLWSTDIDKRDIKKVLYQAIRQCPWSKHLYLDAIRLYPDEFQSFVDLMMEKEIRVHLPIEELSLLMKSKAQQQTDQS